MRIAEKPPYSAAALWFGRENSFDERFKTRFPAKVVEHGIDLDQKEIVSRAFAIAALKLIDRLFLSRNPR